MLNKKMHSTVNLDEQRSDQLAPTPASSAGAAPVAYLGIAICLSACALLAIAITVVLALIPVYIPTREMTVTNTISNHCALKKQSSVYDYIVVGSGPGGTTIATRLALNNFQVLLIEAGPDYDGGDTRTPDFWPGSTANPEIAANFRPFLFSKEDGTTILYPRGMTLGGSAQINALVAMTVNPIEWDYIADVTGDSDWRSANIINRYQPLVENCQFCPNNGTASNKNGWLPVSTPARQSPSPQLRQTQPALNDLIEGFNARLPYNPNAFNNTSFDSRFDIPESVSQETNTRFSTYRRIKNVQSTKGSNLHIWTDTFVTKLLIDPRSKDACGVEYISGSHLYKASPLSSPSLNSNNVEKSTVYAKREVIVAGGQWLTPQLLQLSGIGDRDLLKQFGIKVIQHLPGVGKNHQEQSEMSYIVKLKNNTSLTGALGSKCSFNSTGNDPCLTEYLANRTGSIYSSNGNFFGLFRSAAPIVPNNPDSVFLFTPARFTGIRDNWVKSSQSVPSGSFLSVDVELGRNENNQGVVRIQSKDAFATPLIELKHFQGASGATELSRFTQHFRFLRQFFIEGPFAQYVDYEELPGSQVQTDQQFEQFFREYVWGHHACCTTKMGNTETDPLAVVNSKAHVKGIQNLRICDISIFPKVPGYYPMVPIMIACEKIADDISKAASG